jgi:purine-binding chemotaxis protein CheW
VRVCVFELGQHTFGLRLESVGEIVPMAALSRPPSIPSILEGFLNLRGTAVPVVRIAELLGLPPVQPGLYTPLVIARADTLSVALLVDRVTAILLLPPDALIRIPQQDAFGGCVEGRAMENGASIYLLSEKRLLLAKERQVLTEFQAVEHSRLRQLEKRAS